MPVLGLGGYFFRAENPAALKAWYRDHLGIGAGLGVDPAIGHPDEASWYQQAGPMVFEPFKADTDYFPADKQVMLNLRVSDLAGLLAILRAAGIAVTGEAAMDGVGHFARIHDPEGNPIELWQVEGAA